MSDSKTYPWDTMTETERTEAVEAYEREADKWQRRTAEWDRANRHLWAPDTGSMPGLPPMHPCLVPAEAPS
jgi:hypothetical protein